MGKKIPTNISEPEPPSFHEEITRGNCPHSGDIPGIKGGGHHTPTFSPIPGWNATLRQERYQYTRQHSVVFHPGTIKSEGNGSSPTLSSPRQIKHQVLLGSPLPLGGWRRYGIVTGSQAIDRHRLAIHPLMAISPSLA